MAFNKNPLQDGTKTKLKDYSVDLENRIEVGFDDVADYVIEQGSNFTKWNSGKLECWGKGSNVSLTYTSIANWGPIFTTGGDSIPTIQFPVSFIDTPSVSYKFIRISGGNYWIMESGQPTTSTRTGSWELCRGTGYPGSMTGYMSYYAIGRWK